jgi:hypothetical protein
VIGEAPVPVKEPGVDVAVKVVTAPPVAAAVYVTDAFEPESDAVPIVGASGTSALAVSPVFSVSVDALRILIPSSISYLYCKSVLT